MPAVPASPPWRPPSSDVGHQAFVLGSLLAGRYRIVALLGRGGMGQVYRADDLTLGEHVALKFLPRNFAQDPARRERFHEEVRLARQVSHSNICRVFDIGEADDREFLSMEYVDGDFGRLRLSHLPRQSARLRPRQPRRAIALDACLNARGSAPQMLEFHHDRGDPPDPGGR